MPFRVSCPACQSVYVVPDDSLGNKVKCPKCGQMFAVGSPKTPAPAAPNPPKPAPPKAAATGRTTNKTPAQASSEAQPRRIAIQPQANPPAPIAAASAPPAPRMKSSLRIVGVFAAVLLFLGGAAVGSILANLFFSKSNSTQPVARAARQPVVTEAALPSKSEARPVVEKTEKADIEAAIPPKTAAPEQTENPSVNRPPEPQKLQSPTPMRPPAPAAVHADPTRIKIPVARLTKYEPEKKRWVYSHQGPNSTNGIFYIDILPAGAPTDRDGYAAKLMEKDFQEPGQQFTEITEKGDFPDGFLLKGVVKYQSRPKPAFGFVIVRKINGAFLRCRSGTVDRRPTSDEDLRKAMEDTFKQVTIRTTTLIPLPAPSGAVMLRDNVTLVVAQAETANLIYFDTLAEREVKRVEMDFQPGELIVQGDTIYAVAKGSALVYAVDAATGKAKKEYNLGGDGIVHLACHPRQGMIYASTTKFGVVALDPASGSVHTPKAAGQFLAVSPDGKFLYTGVQPPDLDEIEIIRRRDGSIRIFSDMWGPRAVLTKYEIDGESLRFVSSQNNAAVNGWWMHLTPDGKRLLMVGGGGWRPPKEGGTGGGYITAIFSADNLSTMLQPIPFSGLNTIFHPVLNLGVTNSYGLFVTFFSGKSLVKREEIKISPEREARPLLLMFGGKGRKLILWNGNNVQKEQGLHFLPLPLKPDEEAALDRASAFGPSRAGSATE